MKFPKKITAALLGIVAGFGFVALVHANTNTIIPTSLPPAQNVYLPITVKSDTVQTIKSRLVLDSGTSAFDLDVPSGPAVVQGLYSTGQVIFSSDVHHGYIPQGQTGTGNPNARIQVAALAHGVANTLQQVCANSQGVWELCPNQSTPSNVYASNSCDNTTGNWVAGSGGANDYDATLPYCASGVTYGDPAGTVCAAGSTPASGTVCSNTSCQTLNDTPAGVGATCYAPASCTQAASCSSDAQCNGGACIGYQPATTGTCNESMSSYCSTRSFSQSACENVSTTSLSGDTTSGCTWNASTSQCTGSVNECWAGPTGNCVGNHPVPGTCSAYTDEVTCDAPGVAGADCAWVSQTTPTVPAIAGSCECDTNSCEYLSAVGTSCTSDSQCGTNGMCDGYSSGSSLTNVEYCEAISSQNACNTTTVDCAWYDESQDYSCNGPCGQDAYCQYAGTNPSAIAVQPTSGVCSCTPANHCSNFTGNSCTSDSQCGTGTCNGTSFTCTQTRRQFCNAITAGGSGACTSQSICYWTGSNTCEAYSPDDCHTGTTTPGSCGC